MATESGEGGTHITWTIPIVEKGERLEVSFEITGPGVIDGEAGNRFHGVHFGDEVETEDIASSTDEPEEEPEAEEEVESNISWREDVLLRVMAAADIDVSNRDAFVAHAVNFDLDDNGYLKKAELEAAAKAWNTDASSEEETAEEPATEEPAEESEAEETVEEPEAEEPATEETVEEPEAEEPAAEESEAEATDKNCPICMAVNASDAAACTVCSFTFE